VCKENMTACSGKEAEPETEKPTEQPKGKGNTGGLELFHVVAILGGGGAFDGFRDMKSKKMVKGDTELEDFDVYDYEEAEGNGAGSEIKREEEERREEERT
ncbi:cell surface protein, partial [Anaerobutyricum soehngenii]|uniref:CD1107 family mobile element protein n=1 Tax=Anaerobutyricum soehngenii TaxID=105843 RepID=UPI001FD7A9B9